ncbi:hypothetical protein ACIOWM_37070 [Streptomyces anulatus]
MTSGFPPPLPEVTPASLRHELARQAQQRSESARRRSEGMAALAAGVGGQTEAARVLGISKAAVSRTVNEGRVRPAGPPLADYLEIDLPRCGSQVPTPDEWLAMPDGERRSAAVRASAHWTAIATAAHRIAVQTRAASEWISETVVMGDADGEPRPALVRADDPDPVPGEPISAVYADMAESLARRAQEAWSAADWWRSHADGDPIDGN